MEFWVRVNKIGDSWIVKNEKAMKMKTKVLKLHEPIGSVNYLDPAWPRISGNTP